MSTTTSQTPTNNNNNTTNNSNSSNSGSSFMGWNFFSNLLSSLTTFGAKRDESEVEIKLLLDTVILNKPLLLLEGFIVYTGIATKKKLSITSLSDLTVGVDYKTEKGTTLYRKTQNDLILGDRIVIPVVAPTNESMAENKLYLVMKGKLLPQTMGLALEQFTRLKLSDGIVMRDREAETDLNLTRMDQLVEGVVYVRDASREVVELVALRGGLVRFRFQIGKNALSATSAIGAIDSASESTNVFFAPRAKPKAATTTPTSKFDPLLNSRKLSRRLAAAVAEAMTSVRGVRTPSNKSTTTASTSTSTSSTATTKTSKSNAITPMKLRSALAKTSSKADATETEVDNVDVDTPTLAAAFESQLNIADPPANIPKPPPLPPPKMPNSAKKTKDGARMRTLHWSALTHNQVASNSFWRAAAASNTLSPTSSPSRNIKLDIGAVEAMFALSPAKRTTRSSSNGTPTRATSSSSSSSTRLGTQKAAMLGVIVRGAKLPPIDELLKALTLCDDAVLTEDTLRSLASLLGLLDEDDRRALANTSPNASAMNSAERFVSQLLRDSSFIDERVKALLARATIGNNVTDVEQTLQAIALACDAMRNSSKFAALLRLIFALGTVLNRQTNGAGFKLDSLLRLNETRARDRKTTLLDFLVLTVRQSMPSIEAFATELAAINGVASRRSLADVDLARSTLQSMLECAKTALDRAPKSDSSNNGDALRATLAPFVEQMTTTMQQITTQIATTRAAFVDLATYFGEDETQLPSSEAFFDIVVRFIGQYETSMKRLDNEIKARARQQRSASISTRNGDDSNNATTTTSTTMSNAEQQQEEQQQSVNDHNVDVDDDDGVLDKSTSKKNNKNNNDDDDNNQQQQQQQQQSKSKSQSKKRTSTSTTTTVMMMGPDSMQDSLIDATPSSENATSSTSTAKKLRANNGAQRGSPLATLTPNNNIVSSSSNNSISTSKSTSTDRKRRTPNSSSSRNNNNNSSSSNSTLRNKRSTPRSTLATPIDRITRNTTIATTNLIVSPDSSSSATMLTRKRANTVVDVDALSLELSPSKKVRTRSNSTSISTPTRVLALANIDAFDDAFRNQTTTTTTTTD